MWSIALLCSLAAGHPHHGLKHSGGKKVVAAEKGVGLAQNLQLAVCKALASTDVSGDDGKLPPYAIDAHASM